MPPTNVGPDMPTAASIRAQWLQYATFSGEDTINGVVPIPLIVDGVEYRTIRHHEHPMAPAYTVEQIYKLIATIKPYEWSIRMFSEEDVNAPDPAFNLDTIYVGDGKLLAIASAVGGPWGGGVSLVRAETLALCEDDGHDKPVVRALTHNCERSVDMIGRLLGYC